MGRFAWPSVLLAIALNIIAGFFVIWIVAGHKRGIRPTVETIRTFVRLYSTLSSIRLVRFNRCRADYERHRKTGRTISNYIATAKSSLKLVSFSLITGIHHEGVTKTLQNLLEQNSTIGIDISLLDPRERNLIRAIAPSYGVHFEAMCQDIFDGIDKLFDFKENMRTECRARLHIRVHKVIPFGSAILIDVDEKTGRIQIETKGYKCDLESSWGFEVLAGGRHPFYRTLAEAYKNVVQDSEELHERLSREC